MNVSSTENVSETLLPRSIRFWLLLVFDIPSVACSIFLLYHLFVNKTLRRVLNNHIIIVLLLVNFVSQLIDTSTYLNYLRSGKVWTSTPAMCIVWIIAGYQFYVFSTLLVALASIERHILVFHHTWISTWRRRLLIHYMPLVILLLYCTSYGMVLVGLLLRDGYSYDYEKQFCGTLAIWIQNYPILSILDLIFNEIMPAPLIAIFSIALLVRVLLLKKRIHRRIQWSKQRKMSIQLLSISTLFLLINFPPILLYIAILIQGEENLPGNAGAHVYFNYLTYYQITLLPFICLGSLPEISKKFFSKIPKCLCLRAKQAAVLMPMRVVPNQRI
jgi:hypothetical protein